MAKRPQVKKLPNIPFEDGFGTLCSIQQSSAAKPHIWLGVKGPEKDVVGMKMMHIDKDLAAFLVQQLNHFIETGKINAKTYL